MGDALKGFLEVIVILLFLAFLPIGLLWEILYVNVLGVWTWAILALTLSPYVATFYIVMKRRAVNYYAILFAEPKEWNLEKTLEEYQKLMKKNFEE